ncbi:MAG: hypothetical protein J3K34DRAFT_457611 [Monoraphidium minutum]|nr:MAG: hypothetical protein J3K34DRAFT_457611 [Monoraphidium minutum]
MAGAATGLRGAPLHRGAAASPAARPPIAAHPRLPYRRAAPRVVVVAAQRDDDPERRRAVATALESAEEEDPVPDGVDPSLLPLLGITLDDLLRERAAQAKQDVRARCIGAAVWGALAVAGFLALGGARGYFTDYYTLTAGGAHEDNSTYVWMLALAYFSVKGAAMTAVTLVRAHLFEAAAAGGGGGGESPQAAARRGDGAAWMRWQEARWRREAAVLRAFVQFVASSALLAGLVIGAGGAERAQFVIETLDEGALCRLTIFMWLFWESYLAGCGGMGAGGKAAWAESQHARLLKIRAGQEERRRARIERLRRS